MTHSSHSVKLKLDPEIERTFHILRKTTKKITMEETSSNKSIESSPGFNTMAKLSQESKTKQKKNKEHGEQVT